MVKEGLVITYSKPAFRVRKIGEALEYALDFLISALSVTVVALHVQAVRHEHFVSESIPRNAKMIAAVTIASVAAFLWLTWTQDQPLEAQVAGVLLELAGAALFFAAISASRDRKLRFVFDPTHPHSLIASGPYGFVRHPFYVSYVVFWAGWTIAVWSPWALVSLALLIALYVAAARLEERNFAASPLAADYAAYKRRVGFFWPKLG